jgi:hypothetical protein
MSDAITVKGEIPARIAGVLIIIYGAIIFVSALIAAESIAVGIVLLLAISALAMLVGIGLTNRDYHAWFAAMALTLVSLLGGLLPLALSYTKGVSAESSNLAMKLLWPVIFFCLLLAAKPACQLRHGAGQKVLDSCKRYFAALLAISITLATVLCLKAAGFAAFIFVGFPALIIEFALLYVLGLNIQKRRGWSS